MKADKELNRESFAKLMQTEILDCNRAGELALEFGVNSKTIKQWAAGRNLPHTEAQNIILSYL